jgi:uncharacterized protein YbbC (DUF1343 family)
LVKNYITLLEKINQFFNRRFQLKHILMNPRFSLLLFIFINFFLTIYSQTIQNITPAATRTSEYFPLLEGHKIALVGNNSSKIGNVHLLDTLLHKGIKVQKIFCPEHGFRGNIGAGEKVKTTIDPSTGIRIISLYGKHYKPKSSELADIDIVLFDIQDVGVRFYTYLSTLHYVMEACAENNKQLIVLDRPNPNSFYIDGPVLDMKYKSFVGLHPVPVVYGMTIGEYAQMINGEKWLKNGIQCRLKVILCENFTHASKYILPDRPSPNLPDMQAIYLYPSLALFEGTCINVGRGTPLPFQIFGHPEMKNAGYEYMPEKLPEAPDPMHKNLKCNGINLCNFVFSDSDCFTLKWLIFAYKNVEKKDDFFNIYFYNLSGTGQLIKQIENGQSEKEIKEGWNADIEKFKLIRSKYLLYK